MPYEIDKRLEEIKAIEIGPSEQLIERTKILIGSAGKKRGAKRDGMQLAAYVCMAAAALAFAFIAFFSLNNPSAVLYGETAAIYSLDINPSVELGVDSGKEVMQVKSLNEDGKYLLGQVNCIGMDIKECIGLLIKKAVELGYINEDDVNYIIVSEILIKEQFISIRDDIENIDKPESIKVVFLDGSVEDMENADVKGISTGKEIFYERAKELGIIISDDELVQKSIKELMNDVSKNAEQIFGIDRAYAVPEFSIENAEGFITIKWNKIDDEDLKGYKVVISKNDPEPVYPDNGYLVYITDLDQISYVIDNRIKYSNGDFGGYLADNEAYYINLTAVYSDRSVPGKAFKATFIAEKPVVIRASVRIGGERQSDGTLSLSWDKAEAIDFKGYKIVASADNEDLKYPEDGYIRYIADIDITSAIIGGEYGNVLEMGKEYYFSVTVLYDGENIAGNSVRLKYMDIEETVQRKACAIFGERSDDGSVELNWEMAEDTGFKGYKVVASSSDDHPTYPDDGYIAYITDLNQTSMLVDESFAGKLTYGTEYYFSITVLYNDGNVSGNSIKLRYMDTQTADVLAQSGIAGRRSDDGSVVLTWEKIDSAGFSGYKVVASAFNANPAYPADGYVRYITDRNTTSLIVDGSYSSKLVPGTEYYFSITVLYGDVKVPGNSVKIKYLDSGGQAQLPSSYISGQRQSDGSILLNWEEINETAFDGYKVVASPTDQSPSYPDDGYISWITDSSATSLLVDSSFDQILTPGESYYFSITVLYSGHEVKVPGNSVYLQYK